MKKKIKFYLHHNYYEHTTVNRTAGSGDFVMRGLRAVFAFIFNIFYTVGLTLIMALHLPKGVLNWFKSLPQRNGNLSRNFSGLEFKKTVGIFVFLVVGAAIALQGAILVGSGLSIKEKVLGATDEGIKYLQDAKIALETEDVDKAQINFAKALEQFEQSEKSLQSGSTILRGLLEVIPQKQDGDKLLNAAQLMTNAALDGTAAYSLSQKLKISPEGLSVENLTAKDGITGMKQLIDSGSDKIIAAKALLDDVSVTTLPEDKRPAFLGVKDTLNQLEGSMLSLRDVSDILTSVTLGRKNVLLVFQNNNELRSTGGFIGTIGTAKLIDGSIASLNIRSVYDFDGQMKDYIIPPKPVQTINSRWFLRDGNYFADFRQAAESLIMLYEKEGGETPDMVMAFTPDLIVGLLQRTGPIELPQYGVTLTAENFVETIQTSTSIAYGKELNQPKQLLADFFPALMQKLGSGTSGLVPLVEILQTNLSQKNIQLYSRNEELQSKIESFNWAGRIQSTDRDYLAVVSSNMGGTKTDLFLRRELRLDSEIAADGTITNTVLYTVSNPLNDTDGLQNMSFIRFFVPEHSQLMSAMGFSPPSPTVVKESAEYISDPLVEAVERGSKIDGLTGTHIVQEAGKTYFGNWLAVKGGETKTVSLKYTLPFKLKKLDRFSLLLRKQSGSGNIPFKYNLNFGERNLLWKNSVEAPIAAGVLNSEGTLTTDKYYGIVLQKEN